MANLHAKNEYALKWATRNNKYDVAKLLLKNGAIVHKSNYYYIKYILGKSHDNIIKLLNLYM